ncbi:MAG: hypothetical protein ACLVD2_11315, partial [Blautia sp.]
PLNYHRRFQFTEKISHRLKHLFTPKKQKISPKFFIKRIFTLKKQKISPKFFIKRIFSLKKQKSLYRKLTVHFCQNTPVPKTGL